MVYNNSKTIYGIKLETCKKLNLPYTPLLNTTLNEKYKIKPNYVNEDTTLTPDLNLIVIGIGGESIVDNTVVNLKKSRHSPIDGSLFKPLPFKTVIAGTPLGSDEKDILRLKTIEVYNSIAYDCYYGMVIKDIDYDDRVYLINNSEISLNTSIFDTEINLSILNPEPRIGMLETSNSENFILNSCKINIDISEVMINDLKESAKIVYGIDNLNNISELGLCSSLDVDFNGVKEAMLTQVNYFIDMSLDTQTLYNKITTTGNSMLSIEIGGMEPLLK